MTPIDDSWAVNLRVISRETCDAPFLLILSLVQHLVDVLQICLALLSESASIIKTNLALAVISKSQIVVWLVIWLRAWEFLVQVLILWGNTHTRLELDGSFDLGGLGGNVW